MVPSSAESVGLGQRVNMNRMQQVDGQHVPALRHGHELSPPLFILAPARSFTSVVCAMIGQHPQMYGLPETNLLCYETVGARAKGVAVSARLGWHPTHGLLRAVAELYFGAQTESTIRMSRQWLRTRSGFTTECLFQLLADRVFPRIVVEKSPGTTNNLRCFRRIQAKFPNARFIHLLRHPRGHGESVMKAINYRQRRGPLPSTHWLLRVSSYNSHEAGAQAEFRSTVLDPQRWWYAQNKTIQEFLRSVPSGQQMRVRGEDLLCKADTHLQAIADWMGLRTDAAAIEMMKHPERSPYAFRGPGGGRFGNDRFFLGDPVLRPERATVIDLDAPLGWRDDGQGFLPDVKELAREFGYR